MSDRRCPGCYQSFSGWWCDNCDAWPCTCVADDSLVTDRERLDVEARSASLGKQA